MRFKVVKHIDITETVYCIADTMASKYSLPEMAVSIYFKDFATALQINGLLNKEWKEFLKNA